jgi:thioredoxin reductase
MIDLFFLQFNVAADGGIIVNDRMETSIQDIYAVNIKKYRYIFK